MNEDPLGLVGEMMKALRRAADTALRHVVAVAEVALPLLLPPKDLRLSMGDGSTVTGILLVENNRIIAGLVIHHRAAPGTVVTPPPRDIAVYPARGRFDDQDDDDCRLPGWADGGGYRGGEPWGR